MDMVNTEWLRDTLGFKAGDHFHYENMNGYARIYRNGRQIWEGADCMIPRLRMMPTPVMLKDLEEERKDSDHFEGGSL